MSDLVERLEPCPFCGAPAHLSVQKTYPPLINCTNCEACMDPADRDTTEEQAIAAWNRRAESADLTARTREVLAPFAELVPAAFADVWKGNEQVVLRTHLQGDVAALRINDFRAANTLFNELKEKDNG